VAELAVITGVSRGIGRATALKLAERGVDLALLGRESEAHEATRRACEAKGVSARSYACDVSDAAQIDSAARALLTELGTPDLVIHNAALLLRGPRVHEIAPEDWDRVMATNLRGPFLLNRALLPAMLERRRGRLIHVASISGTIGCPQMAHYGAAKWGLIGLSKALAEELRGSGVMSLAILPGSVDTAMLRQTPFAPDMTPEDVADVMVYYGLDAPAAVHGACVEIMGPST
jgi:3-oxoacyl-[acyl-carrier protein] reductase